MKGACGIDGDKGEKVSGCPRGATGAWMLPGGCGPLDPLHQLGGSRETAEAGAWPRGKGTGSPPLPAALG